MRPRTLTLNGGAGDFTPPRFQLLTNMAATITYDFVMNPWKGTVNATSMDGGFDTQVILSTTNFDAIKLLIQEIQAGTNVSSVVTAINAL